MADHPHDGKGTDMVPLLSTEIMVRMAGYHHTGPNTPENVFAILCIVAVVLILIGLAFNRD